MMIENFIKCPGLGNLGVGMYGNHTQVAVNKNVTYISMSQKLEQKVSSCYDTHWQNKDFWQNLLYLLHFR